MTKKVKKIKRKPKSYLTKRGYTIVKNEYSTADIDSCKKDLMMKPFVNAEFSSNPTPFPIYLESPKKLYLPRHYGLQKFGEPEINKIPEGREIDLTFNGKLREIQKPIVDAFLDTCESGGLVSSQTYGGVISVPCGVGKTIISLYILSQLKRKTLIIVHKEFLIEQWIERIETFLPEARIGLIRQKKVDILNEDTFDDFGFCCIDECHHISAEVFSRALPKIGCKYMCGLSATPKRSDGLSCIFEYYLGPIVYKIDKRGEDNVLVNIVTINSDVEPYTREELTNYGKMCMSRMINNICEYKKRTIFIVHLIKKMLTEKRKILILSDRRGNLKDFGDILGEMSSCSVGYYVGGMKPQDRKASEGCDVILGTFSMASEGMDIPALDSIILASPKSNITQSIGRILRKQHIDKPALVYDIVDNFASFQRQGIKRRRFYKRCKYTILLSTIYDTQKTTAEELYKQSLEEPELYYDSKKCKSPKKTTKRKKKNKTQEIADLKICPL